MPSSRDPKDKDRAGPEDQNVTAHLKAWSAGDAGALDRLTPLVYAELRRLARGYMARERKGHTLETGALINEAFMRLVDWDDANWQNRSHFYGLAANMMRRVLVDHHRSRSYKKRGGAVRPVALDEALLVSPQRGADLCALDEALERLAAIDSRKSKVVELKFFGGLTNEETAKVLDVSPFTVIRDWNFAKAWLYRELDATSG